MSVIDINLAAKKIEENRVVAIAGSSVFELVAKASLEGKKRVFKMKKKPIKQRAIYFFPDYQTLAKYVQELPEHVKTLIKSFTPGNMVFLLNSNEKLGLGKKIACAIPGDSALQKLLQKIGEPLVGSSANFNKRPTSTSASMVEEYFGQDVDICQGQAKLIGVEKTFLDCTKKRSVQIISPGLYSGKDIAQALPKNIAISYKKTPKRIEKLEQIRKTSFEGLTVFRTVDIRDIPKTAIVFGTKETLGEAFGLGGYFKDGTIEQRFLVNLGSSTNLENVAKNLYKNIHKAYQFGYSEAYILWQDWGRTSYGKVINHILLKNTFSLIEATVLENNFMPNHFYLERLLGKSLRV